MANENYNDTIEIKRYEYQNTKDELEFLRGCVKENAIESTKICKENAKLKFLVGNYKDIIDAMNTYID